MYELIEIERKFNKIAKLNKRNKQRVFKTNKNY